MKQELEAEYLAMFKKTVAMHEAFLTRLATHPVFRLTSTPRVIRFYQYTCHILLLPVVNGMKRFLMSFPAVLN